MRLRNLRHDKEKGINIEDEFYFATTIIKTSQVNCLDKKLGDYKERMLIIRG